MLYYVNRSNWNRAGTDRRRRLIHNVKRCGSRRVAESKNHMSNVLGCNKKLLKFAPKNLPNWNWLRRGTSFWRSMLTVRKTLRIAKMTSDQLCCCVRRTDILLRMYKDNVNFVEEQHAKCNWRRDGKSEAHENGAAKCWSKNLKYFKANLELAGKTTTNAPQTTKVQYLKTIIATKKVLNLHCKANISRFVEIFRQIPRLECVNSAQNN